MFTKILLSRIVLVAVTAAAVSGLTAVVLNNRSTRPLETVPAAQTSPARAASRANATVTNVGGSTHGNPSGNATFNGNDQGTGGPPTPGLAALFKGITVKARSVSAVVHAPAGLAVTNTTEISVLFGNRRVSQNYDRANGTTIAFNYPVGDGKSRNEVLTINLTEQAPGGAVAYHWNRLAVIEPLFEVTVSDLTFTLINDCDVVGDSEIVLNIGDDRGSFDVELSMSGGETRHVHKLSRHLPAAKVSDGLIVPSLSFFEDDPGGFSSSGGTPTGPALLPGTTRHLKYDSHDPGDEFCNGHFDYIIAIDLLTFTSL
jgi:hypothetical protein